MDVSARPETDRYPQVIMLSLRRNDNLELWHRNVSTKARIRGEPFQIRPRNLHGLK